ncbi:PREDICTED: uncharacterized protein LOC109234460 isoform X2 [Nicotiana attenuata]|uniref:Uncharacterized protein n=1 Tax=Nicotiana attenuata TaxID=49451 RepID=A0A1J6HWB8_NICAT|nr:PREDICTED: uncharacterized protein LOC109234460 isoform X2 [Nicotiana attenuata]OIS97156.1 hypothetical protein A4A49_08156 [Nicotiana attenuata]
MKRSIEGFNQINCVEEEAKAKLKQKHLLNEFLELQKEFVSKKRKLQAAKQRRDIILGEILFLKQRRRYLLKSQSSNVDSERDIPHMKNFDTESEVPEEERFNSGYDAAGQTARPAFTSKFNSGYEVGDDEVLAGRDVLRLECVPMNYLIDDNGVGKKKLSWHGEVTLKITGC